MSSLITALGIDRMSVDERLQLVHEIWESLDTEMDRLPLTEAQSRELDRRVAALDANPEAVTPWETVEAKAMKRRVAGVYGTP
jgi:putative addiction module component (TIGR02574 family)